MSLWAFIARARTMWAAAAAAVALALVFVMIAAAAEERWVTSVQRIDGRVIGLCDEGADWSPRSVEDAIADIEAGRAVYRVDLPTPPRPRLIVMRYQGRAFLGTTADGSLDHNLASLPECDAPYSGPDAG
ncbi:MAG: DUF3892 domain-containing protein [Maricaulaceae bacterium]|jgi:hypothetical protein